VDGDNFYAEDVGNFDVISHLPDFSHHHHLSSAGPEKEGPNAKVE
jgi:hypothetical protein